MVARARPRARVARALRRPLLPRPRRARPGDARPLDPRRRPRRAGAGPAPQVPVARRRARRVTPLVVVCVSGGMDSCVTAAIAARTHRLAFLHADYGQRTE